MLDDEEMTRRPSIGFGQVALWRKFTIADYKDNEILDTLLISEGFELPQRQFQLS